MLQVCNIYSDRQTGYPFHLVCLIFLRNEINDDNNR